MSENTRLALHLEGQQAWRDTLHSLFPQPIPDKKEWRSLGEIAEVLNVVGKRANHAFFPQGGGLDVENAHASIHEDGCLEIKFDGGTYIVKPEKLTFFKINGTLLCSYFKLSLRRLPPSGIYADITDYEEVIDTNGNYSHADGDYPSEEESRRVARLLQGEIFIFGKGSPYNVVSFSNPPLDAYVKDYSKRDLPEDDFNKFLDGFSLAYKEKILDTRDKYRIAPVKFKFMGSLNELKKLVEEKGFVGEWSWEKLITTGIKHKFKSKDDGVLNYWESSNTVLFQGKAEGREALFNFIRPYLQKEERQPIEGVRAEDEYDE